MNYEQFNEDYVNEPIKRYRQQKKDKNYASNQPQQIIQDHKEDQICTIQNIIDEDNEYTVTEQLQATSSGIFNKSVFFLLGVQTALTRNAVLTSLDFFNLQFGSTAPQFTYPLTLFASTNLLSIIIIFVSYLIPFKVQFYGSMVIIAMINIGLPVQTVYYTDEIGYMLSLMLVFLLGSINAIHQSCVMGFSNIFSKDQYGVYLVSGTGMAGVIIGMIRLLCLLAFKQSEGLTSREIVLSTICYFSISGILVLVIMFISIYFQNTKYCRYWMNRIKEQYLSVQPTRINRIFNNIGIVLIKKTNFNKIKSENLIDNPAGHQSNHNRYYSSQQDIDSDMQLSIHKYVNQNTDNDHNNVNIISSKLGANSVLSKLGINNQSNFSSNIQSVGIKKSLIENQKNDNINAKLSDADSNNMDINSQSDNNNDNEFVSEYDNISTLQVFRTIKLHIFMVWLNFTITYSLFPGVMLRKKQSMMDISFHTTILVLIYNTFDTIGKLLSSYAIYSTKSISVFVVFRILFIPALIYTIQNDIEGDYWILMGLNVLLSITEGYCAGALIQLAPTMVNSQNQKKMVGYMMSFPIFMGLFTGSLLALIF